MRDIMSVFTFLLVGLYGCWTISAMDGVTPVINRVCMHYSYSENNASRNNTEICKGPDYYCFALWSNAKLPDNTTATTVIRKGCFRISYEMPNVQHPCGNECIQQPAFDSMAKKKNISGFCCCDTNYCNRNFTMTEYDLNASPTPPRRPGPKLDAKERITIIVGVILALTTILTTGFTCYYCLYKKNKSSLLIYTKADPEEKEPPHSTLDLSQLNLKELIGQGRYGTVWKATLNEKLVAVKVFSPENRFYWQVEKEFYECLGMKTSPYILKFIDACERPLAFTADYLLLTEYHSRGSLRHYLQNNDINWKEMCVLGYTMASGLAFIHQEEGTRPAFAHRDFNSKNLLVKLDGTCALADFGFAMKVPDATKPADDGTLITEVGTLRYMAPEVLDGAVNLHDIQGALKQIDIYAMALVLWETAMRCEDIFGKGLVPEFKLPFEGELGPMITSEAMHTFVVSKKLRPGFPDAWKNNHPGIRSLKETIEDCWDQDGDARLLALCVKDRLQDLLHECPGKTCDNVSIGTVQDFQQNFMLETPEASLMDKNTMYVTLNKDDDATVV